MLNIFFQASLSNTTKLLRISRGRGKIDFLFVGQPAEVYQAVDVSAYVPKATFLPIQLPSMIELLSHYMASFSGKNGGKSCHHLIVRLLSSLFRRRPGHPERGAVLHAWRSAHDPGPGGSALPLLRCQHSVHHDADIHHRRHSLTRAQYSCRHVDIVMRSSGDYTRKIE